MKKTKPVKTWLVLDVSNLAYRAAYAHGGLSHGTTSTSVQYGVFRDVKNLRTQFAACELVFCFDWPPYHRKEVFPKYKSKPKDPEREKVSKIVRVATRRLRKVDLPACGFRNLVRQKGFEADDMMALVCPTIPFEDQVVLVSGDEDLYQLLSPRVSVYHPRTKIVVTKEGFKKDYGIEPSSWSLVKALGGCTSDGIPGLVGVGEKTALRYVRGDMGHREPTIPKVCANQEALSTYMRLTTIPYPGTKSVVLKKDRFSQSAWEDVMDGYGIRTLKEK